MSSIWLAVTSVISLLGAHAIHEPAGEEYAPEGGNFAIRFPGKPKETTQQVKSPIGDVKVTTATFATSDGNVYMVSYTDLPPAATRAENLDTLFRGVKEGAKGGKDGNVRTDGRKDFESGAGKQFPEYDLVVERTSQIVKLRVILVEKRLYQIAVVGSETFSKSKDAATFLESFSLSK